MTFDLLNFSDENEEAESRTFSEGYWLEGFCLWGDPCWPPALPAAQSPEHDQLIHLRLVYTRDWFNMRLVVVLPESQQWFYRSQLHL